MKKKQKEAQDILSYHTQAAGCSDKARAKASGGRQPIEAVSYTHLDVYKRQIQDMRSVAGGEYCLLIAPENGTDGLLVRSEGSSCARYSAYIPGGRLMTLVTPELERALRKCETAAKEAVRRECK